jgi:DDE superfamily endonuclease
MRIRIEMAFGRLTTKWRILGRPLQTHLPKTVLIVEVVCHLHNWQQDDLSSGLDENGEEDEIVIEDHISVRGKFGYYESGDDPAAEESDLAALYDAVITTNSVCSSIALTIQQNQWQQPDGNLLRNEN